MGEKVEYIKWFFVVFGLLVIATVISVLVYLGVKGTVGVENANIDRKIYEQSKSYIHGKTQDLTKYYEEYQQSDETGKQAIRNLIQMNFAELDETKIENRRIRIFLQEMRGY